MEKINKSEYIILEEFESDEQNDLFFHKNIPSCAIAHSNKDLKCYKCSKKKTKEQFIIIPLDLY